MKFMEIVSDTTSHRPIKPTCSQCTSINIVTNATLQLLPSTTRTKENPLGYTLIVMTTTKQTVQFTIELKSYVQQQKFLP